MRFPLEVLEAVRKLVPNMVLEIRVSAQEDTEDGLQLEDSLRFMERAQEFVDIIHISRGVIFFNYASTYTTPTYFMLKDIENVTMVTNSVLSTNGGLTDATNATSTSISVVELYDLVKKFDKEFSSSESSKVVDEDGRPLVVYHGTDADFTVFDSTKSRANMDIQGSFFSPWEDDAMGYGGKVGAYYLGIKNPADERTAYQALRRFHGQNEAGRKARDYLIK